MKKVLVILLCLVGCKEENPHHLVKVGPSHYANPYYYADELTYKAIDKEWATSLRWKGYEIRDYVCKDKPEIKDGVWTFTTVGGTKIALTGDVICKEIQLTKLNGEFLTEKQFRSARYRDLRPDILQEVIDKYGDGQ